VWQQDGATAHTAHASVHFLRDKTSDFIAPDEWPSKSPDLNVMDYCIWGILLSELQNHREEIRHIDDLKLALTAAWDAMDMEVVRKATEGWIGRLRLCMEVDGGHFEHLK